MTSLPSINSGHRLASEAGVQSSTVGNLESQSRQGRQTTWEKLAAALDTTPAYLLFGVRSEEAIEVMQ